MRFVVGSQNKRGREVHFVVKVFLRSNIKLAFCSGPKPIVPHKVSSTGGHFVAAVLPFRPRPRSFLDTFWGKNNCTSVIQTPMVG